MQKVRVYWNLHSKIWSVQDVKSGRVCDHVQHISLTDAKFVVRKGGQKRVREEGKKNVHAFAVGYVAEEQVTASQGSARDLQLMFKVRSYHWHRVTYNPYKHDYFMLGEEEVPRDWVGNINMESLYHEHGIASRVYI